MITVLRLNQVSSFTLTRPPKAARLVFPTSTAPHNLQPPCPRNIYNTRNYISCRIALNIAQQIWAQLYFEGEGKSGIAFPIEPTKLAENEIQELAVVIQEERHEYLDFHSSHLMIYKAGTEFPPNEDDRLHPRAPVPEDSSCKNPLRVVAPAIESWHGKFF